jgi:ubiquinone/menaquinone biosynthesis C-methylase UbiE
VERRPSSQAFDAVARSYDDDFTRSRLGRDYRNMVWTELEQVFCSGDRVLELGCGTGEDTVWLARRGIRVLATDISSAMLEVTRDKARIAGVDSRVETRQLELARFSGDEARFDRPFDGALSNFGPLNCVPDRTGVARALASLVRPGGVVVTVLMGPVCPWEIAWHLAHGKLHTAFRRFRSGASAQVGRDGSVAVWYPTPRRVRHEFAPGFRLRRTAAIGCFLPPPYLGDLVQTRPGLIRRLARLESRWRRSFPFTWLGDHFLQVFERCP